MNILPIEIKHPHQITDRLGAAWQPVPLGDANELLARAHYLGPISGGRLILGAYRVGELVAVQVWRHPTSRRLPTDGTWLELSRWCLTPEAGPSAGSRQHRAAVRYLREHLPAVTTLVSYSDPSAGHTGALYRACNWRWSPTWLRLRPPPSQGGRWSVAGRTEAVKDRWVFAVAADPARAKVLAVNDPGAIRAWRRAAPTHELRWASVSPADDLQAAS